MTDSEKQSDGEQAAREKPPTAPDTIRVSLHGFDTEEDAQVFAERLVAIVRSLSRHIDCSSLDGITVAFDYNDALAQLDRGYETTHVLEPSGGRVVGVAMTPSVIRDGKLKSHIVFNAHFLLPIEDFDHAEFGQALHLLAHECAHVEVTAAWERAFPGMRLKEQTTDMYEGMSNEVIIRCWDEYAVCWIVHGIGRDPVPDYEETLIATLEATREETNAAIRAYRLHADLEDILRTTWKLHGDLLKFASYYAGALAGQGLALADRPAMVAALEGNWFKPHFLRLQNVMETLTGRWDEWESRDEFQPIADIAIAMMEDGGLHLSSLPDGGVHLNIPYSPETMP